MYNRALLFCVAFILLFSLTRSKHYTHDYCWKDYDGNIPPDAIEGGKNKNGKMLYIGQVLHESKIIPGKLFDGDDKIYFEYFNVEYSVSQNIKVLCAKTKKTFQWIPTSAATLLSLLPGKKLIKGGFEPNCSTYLGRIKITGGIEVGKVMCCKPDSCYGLYITDDNVGKLEPDFEVLAYNNSGDNDDNEPEDTIEKKTPNKGIKEECKHITVKMFY